LPIVIGSNIDANLWEDSSKAPHQCQFLSKSSEKIFAMGSGADCRYMGSMIQFCAYKIAFFNGKNDVPIRRKLVRLCF
jgi:hypothetical protein